MSAPTTNDYILNSFSSQLAHGIFILMKHAIILLVDVMQVTQIVSLTQTLAQMHVFVRRKRKYAELPLQLEKITPDEHAHGFQTLRKTGAKFVN